MRHLSKLLLTLSGLVAAGTIAICFPLPEAGDPGDTYHQPRSPNPQFLPALPAPAHTYHPAITPPPQPFIPAITPPTTPFIPAVTAAPPDVPGKTYIPAIQIPGAPFVPPVELPVKPFLPAVEISKEAPVVVVVTVTRTMEYVGVGAATSTDLNEGGSGGIVTANPALVFAGNGEGRPVVRVGN